MIRSSALLLIPLFLFGQTIYSAEPVDNRLQKGRVQLFGSIVDTGCAMRVGNEGQTVTFQPAALHGLVRGDASFQQPLNIYLSDCGNANNGSSARVSRTLELTFEGENSGRYFGVQGAAQGIALQIKDAHGKLITPGMLLEDSSRIADTLALNYFLELVGTGNTLQAGNYHATIKLSIQHF
ncbi:fimbrial protein [Pseudomonas kulmbachensis]|uniref:fimbrial protein n=1 Tax=Pseudomonas kulmbachensis TaxID=3043408 RepID=UPI002AB1E6B1|nr:fimbrial protein [Pseudomonas sp. V3/3/4/13]